MVTAGRGRGIVIGTGASTAIGKIRDAMAEAQEQDTPLKQKLDQFGTFLSKVIAVICVLVWVVNLPHFNDPLHGSWFGGALYYFKIAVALAVAAIPEGLPAVVTTCLALGTRQMAKRNAIVRRLPSVETLGCTTVIASDKTGTLTTNQMSAVRIAVVNGTSADVLEEFEVTGTSYAPEGKILEASTGKEVTHPADMPALLHTAACSALCNDSHLTYSTERGVYQRIGEATEVALRVLAEKIGLSGYSAMPSALQGIPLQERATYCNDHWEQQHRKLYTLEFSRDRKMMSTLCTDAASGKLTLFVKGAPENVLQRCTTVLLNGAGDGSVTVGRGGGTIPMTPDVRRAVQETVQDFGRRRALRCLALAMRPWTGSSRDAGGSAAVHRKDIRPEDENDLCFVGLVGMQDPPRPEVRAAIRECHAAGIRVIMVTGDNKATAESVSHQINLLPSAGLKVESNITHRSAAISASDSTTVGIATTGVAGSSSSSYAATTEDGINASPSALAANFSSLSGIEFDELPPNVASIAVSKLSVFSRVEPAHKSKLVEALQSQGHVVAMTGDGVNDAPALKRADIGIAMGSGTAVAKHAADMVLADDNFATIVAAVAAGRAIYANTKQFIRYMVSSNIGEVVAIFSAAVLGIPECLNPVQLLWVNLVTDGLPATAIGFNTPDRDIMRRSPRRADEGIVDGWMFVRYLVVGAYVGIATAAGFIWWFVSYEGGPLLTWAQLRDFQHCTRESQGLDAGTGETGSGRALFAQHEASSLPSCDVFQSRAPSTISMSVLVIVEMFNALNALSENCSLVTLPPWSNPWLLGAIAVSVILHLIILYVPPLAVMFSVTALSWAEWKTVLWLSAPVILVDEILKFISRAWFAQNVTQSKASSTGTSSGVGASASTTSLSGMLYQRMPGWHAARTAWQQYVYPARGRDLDRKMSGEGLPLVDFNSSIQQQSRSRYHA